MRTKVANEAVKFAKLLRTVPVVKGWPNHPAIRPMLRSFVSLNKALASRDARGYVSASQQARMGREFTKIGRALVASAKKRGTRRRAKR